MTFSRRNFLGTICATAASAQMNPEIVIDIHQHTNYAGRTDDELIAHQRRMGVSKTILLPSGSKFGLAVGAGDNDTVVALAQRLPRQFAYFANEVPGLPNTAQVISDFLKQGGIGIGEQKFGIRADSKELDEICGLAADFRVPVLLHFQHETYNLDYASFGKTLAKYRGVNFIGHAQTFWANIDKKADQKVLYPKGPVTQGGLTDRFLSDYPNFWGDLSAGSGLNALSRDEEHAREFLKRHQDRLLYGSDCNDKVGDGSACSGSQMLAAIRRLTDAGVRRKLLAQNAVALMPKLSL